MEENFCVEEILVHGDEERLNELKSWMFQENIRLEIERQNLKDRESSLNDFEADLNQRKEDFIKEKAAFRDETNLLNHKLVQEKQKLTQDNLFFEKKMAILKSGFEDLEADRQKLKREKDEFYRKVEDSRMQYTFSADSIALFFQGVTNILVLKKRYRDLCKIFHPDNLAGDHIMFRLITEEYEKRVEEFSRRAAN